MQSGQNPTALAVCALATSVAAAGDPPGRYTMSPAEGGGFVRLDTQTGQMALCRQRDQQWACQDMPAPGPAVGEELTRLRAENQALKSEIHKLEEMMMGDDKRASGRRAERPGGEGFKLPSEQDVDQAMDYLGLDAAQVPRQDQGARRRRQGDAALSATASINSPRRTAGFASKRPAKGWSTSALRAEALGRDRSVRATAC